MPRNSTAEILLARLDMGKPTGLALSTFWMSVMEYLADKYGYDVSKATDADWDAIGIITGLSL